MLTKILTICLLLCSPVLAQKGSKKSNSEVLKMFGYEKQANKHKKYPYVQIGDSTKAKGPARIRMSGWDDEVWFEIDLGGSSQLSLGPNFTKSKGKRNGQDSVRFTGNQFHHAMFMTDGGNFEWSIVLNQTLTNYSFTFPFSSNGLTFSWQDTLTDEEVAEGAFRPDSVIHSYAVFHATKANNYNKADGTTEEYLTGKYGHIYRLKAWGSNNDTTWGMINIDVTAGEITLSVEDSTWQANVTPPITIDPTFGETGIGASTTDIVTTRCHGLDETETTYQAGPNEEVTEHHFYGSAADKNLSLAVYSVTGVDPYDLSTRIADTSVIVISSSAAWYSRTGLTDAMTSGTRYAVAWGKPQSGITEYYDNAPDNDGRKRQNNSTLGVTFSNDSQSGSRTSLYVTYASTGEPAADISYVRRIKEGEGK